MEQGDQERHKKLEFQPMQGINFKQHYTQIFTHIRINAFYTF